MTVPKSGLSLNCIRQLLPGAITNNSFEAIPGEAFRIHVEDHVHKVPQANTAELQCFQRKIRDMLCPETLGYRAGLSVETAYS